MATYLILDLRRQRKIIKAMIMIMLFINILEVSNFLIIHSIQTINSKKGFFNDEGEKKNRQYQSNLIKQTT